MFVTLEQKKMLALLLLMRRRRRRQRAIGSSTRVVSHYNNNNNTPPPYPPYSPSPRRPRPQKQQKQQQQKEEEAEAGDDQREEKVVGVQNQKQKQRKRVWVTPFLKTRNRGREYHQALRQDEDRFMADFTLSVRQFDLLLDRISADIYRRDTAWREAIDPAERLAICLRYLTTGDSYSAISKTFRVGKSTCVGILSSVSDAIWNSLVEEYMPAPKKHEWKAIADEFGQRWDFPHCVGALEAKHVVIKAPSHSKSHKEQFSIVLLAVVDASGLFRTVDVGAFGKSSDGEILSASEFGKALHEGTLDLPDDSPIQTAEHLGPVPYVFAADEALPLQRNVLCPFPGRPPHVDSQRVLNYHLSRARGVAESAFGSLASQFRVYHRVLEVSPGTAEKIVKATAVLHNFLRRDRQQDTAAHVAVAPVETTADALRPVGMVGSHCASPEALSVREKFTEYFNSPATAVAWLNDYV